MAYRDLQAFIKALEQRGELARITVPVSPLLEITEITDRIVKSGGKALLFENVEGSPYPVLINAMGTPDRAALALGANRLDEIGQHIAQYLDFGNYGSLGRLLRFCPKLPRLAACFPLRLSPAAPCRQVVERDPDLTALPVLKCWPLDGGRFFTLPLVFTKFPGSKTQNAGMYRMQLLDKNTTAMHWHKHKDGSAIYEAWREKGPMPVSVALGCDPAITYAATAPLPPGLDEMLLAGFLRRRPVVMSKCVTNDLYVPRDAQFVLEGYVDPREAPVWEGPFGDHTGYYSLADWYPRFHVTCLTRRRNPVYHAAVVGRPPMEDCYLAKATERIFLPFLRTLLPQLADLHCPFEGVFHNCVVAAVKKDFPGAAATVMNGIWGMGQMRCTKLIVAVDADMNLENIDKVLEAVLRNVDPARDLVFSAGPLDALDHASPQALYGTRLGVDATRKEKPPQSGRLAVIRARKEPFGGRRALETVLADPGVKLAVAVDEDVDPTDRSAVFWRLCNQIDAGRDLLIRAGRMGVDATRKSAAEGLARPWPEDIVMSAEIRKRVDRRWKEYKIEE